MLLFFNFRYQKKIGTYDKQQWEKRVEQKIFCGFTHVPMRSAKLKTEFIDVDLVRGNDQNIIMLLGIINSMKTK